MMKRLAWIAGFVVALCLLVQPALAQVTTCPAPNPNDNEACAQVTVGATAEDIADALGLNWNLPNYACGNTGATVTITAGASEKGITFSVTGDAMVDSEHALNMILVDPVGTGGPPAFDILVEFDGGPPTLLTDGTTNFADITLTLETLQAGSTLPMLSGRRTALFVFGLLIAGVAIIAFRQTS